MSRFLSIHPRRLLSSIVEDITNTPKNLPLVAPTPTFNKAAAPSGLRLASFDRHGPASAISLVIPAGARYESLDHQGVASFLSNYAFQYTSNSTPLAMAREIEIRGIHMRCKTTRDYMVYDAQFLRDDLDFVLSTLYDVVANTQYYAWEYQQVKDITLTQAKSHLSDPATLAFEHAHRLAFRKGLGNSIHAPAFPTITNSDIIKFKSAHLQVNSKSALFGVNVPMDELNEKCSALFNMQPSNENPTDKSVYQGGETRLEVPAGHNVTLAFPGGAQGSKLADTLSVLSAYLGDGTTYVKWGTNSQQVLLNTSHATNTHIKTFNATYSDAGLFGISASCILSSPAALTDAVRAGVSALKAVADGSGLQAGDFQRALAQAKSNMLFAMDSAHTFSSASAMLLAANAYCSPKDRADKLDQVSALDVATAAKNMLALKPTVVVAGNPARLPYPDQLGL